jgi:hypothetical protein
VEPLNNLDLLGCDGMFDVLYGLTTVMQTNSFGLSTVKLLFCIDISIKQVLRDPLLLYGAY